MIKQQYYATLTNEIRTTATPNNNTIHMIIEASNPVPQITKEQKLVIDIDGSYVIQSGKGGGWYSADIEMVTVLHPENCHQINTIQLFI